MSATFDTDEFANYFKNFSGKETIPAPIITVKKPGLYTTTIHYLDHMPYQKTDAFSLGKPEVEDAAFDAFIFLIGAFDRLDKMKAERDGGETRKIGSVLVFLPGIYEIEEAFRRLTLKAKE